MLVMTAAAGQMSQMVFAVTRRGKTKGTSTGRIEVGSWVIGYWRPALHFEINVWNCFENRARRLLKSSSLAASHAHVPTTPNLERLLEGQSNVHLVNEDARTVLSTIPDDSVSLVITDPPHGDRIPYLELSELWNAILRKRVHFD
jgi:hypothetical protein